MEISRESIFVSSVRAFFSGLFATIGVLVIFILIAVFAGGAIMGSSSITAEKATVIIEPDAEGKRAMLPATAPVILLIDIHGPIMAPNLVSSNIRDLLLDSREGMLKGDRVKGVLLHINTPGGTATDSNAIYNLLREYKKRYDVPIYSYTDGLCASGGMFITSACDKNYASEVSIIGSVGVIMGPAFNYVGLMQKLGVEARTLTKGKDKQMFPAFEPWDPPQDESLRAIIAAQYKQFVDIVVKDRTRLTKEKLVNEYGAQVFIAPDAEEKGYIDDGNASYDKALTELVQAAKIEGDYQVVKLKAKRSLLELLSKPHPFEKLATHLGLKESGEQSPILYLYKPR